LLSGIVSAMLGILRATGGGYETRAVDSHRWTGIAVVVTTLLTFVVQRFAYRDETRRALTVAYRSLLTATLTLLVIAGHIGGNLTHGAKYLTENAPAFVRDFFEEKSPETADATPAGKLDEKQRFFAERVQPILEAKCIRCHGLEKQKGDYRLDEPVVALKGGESGKAAIKPGDPLGSELVRLILLPPDDDDVMPPKGKEPITGEEVLTIIRWIQKGAPFPAAATSASAH
ncbi:MAG: c-type cytochrome domain-containing protein, partial [Chthoniobacteraceae bacterium]